MAAIYDCEDTEANNKLDGNEIKANGRSNKSRSTTRALFIIYLQIVAIGFSLSLNAIAMME